MRDRRHAALAFAAGMVILASADVSLATATWSGTGSTGGSGTSASLIDPNNWVGGVVPHFGTGTKTDPAPTTNADDAVFTGNTNLTITVPNDLISQATDAIFRNLTFDANAGAFVFVPDGSPEDEMVFNYPTNGVLTENDSPNPQTFNNTDVGMRKGTLNAAAGDFVFNPTNGFFIGNGSRSSTNTFTGAHNIYLNTGFHGATDALKTGTGTMFIGTPVNPTPWTGAMLIAGGTVQISNSNSLGATGLPGVHQQTEISSAAGTLALTNNITVGEYINLDGRTGTTAQILNVSGHNILNGTIVSNQLSSGAPNFVFQSDGTAPGDSLEISSSATLQQSLPGNAVLVLQGAGNGLISGLILDTPDSNPASNATWSVDKKGGGTWTLNSPTGYGGTTTVEQGILAVTDPGSVSVTPSIAVNSGATLDLTAIGGIGLAGSRTLKGAGTVLGPVTAGGGSIISPGDSGAGTLTVGGLSLNDGTVVQYEFASTPAGASDDIHVTGNLSLSGTTTMALSVIGGGAAVGTYRVFDYDGSLSGDASNLHIANVSSAPAGTTRQTFAFDSSTLHQINLTIGGAPAANLTWVGAVSSSWDLKSTVNFTGDTQAIPDNRFFNGDSVTFDDSGANTSAINIAGTLVPAKLTFNNSAGHPYNLSGGDVIVGGNLTVGGTGNITFANAGLTVAGNVTAGGGGTLSIANSGATTFSGNVTTSGSRGLTIANTGGNPVVIVGGLNFGGSGAGSVSNNSGLSVGGNLTVGGSVSLAVSKGTLSVAGNFNSTGSGNTTFTNSDLSVAGTFSQNGTGKISISNTGALSLPALAINSGTLAFGRSDNISVGALTGTGTLRQEGFGTVALTGDNSGFGGAIIVANGTLQLGAGSNMALGTATTSTTVLSGGTLDLNRKNNLGPAVVTIAGTGAPGQLGALVDNSGSGTNNANRSNIYGVILSADATIYAPANTFPFVRDSVNGTAASFQGNGHNLTVAGPGEWDFESTGETHLANITLKDNTGGDGTYFDGTTTVGDQPGIITLMNDGTLASENYNGAVTKNFVVDPSGSGHGGILAYRSDLSIASQVTINGTSLDGIVDSFWGTGLSGTFTLSLDGKLTGPGGLNVHDSANGTGAIVASRLGTVAITNDANDFAGPITIGGGYGSGFGIIAATVDRVTLSIGNGGTTGVLPGGDVTINALGTLAFNKTTTYNFANKITGAGNIVASAGAVTLTGNLSYTGATTVNGGLLRAVSSIASSSGVTVNATGIFEAGSTQTLAALTINDGGRAQIGGGTKKILTVGSSASTAAAGTITGTGVLDVNNGELILPYAAGSSPIAAVVGYLTSGFNVGGWNGAGINSTAAHNDASFYTALGYDDNGSQVAVDYTYYGDSNLDGLVTTADFQLFLDGFTGHGSTWARGDYTYDGKVDLGNDFNLFLRSYLHNGGALGDLAPIIAADDQLSAAQKASMLSVVPEPSSLAVIGMALTSLAARRRRKV
jgi:fibronectin-binding autotransporter adhesin